LAALSQNSRRVKFDEPFYRLPLRFDAERLAAEVRQLPAEAWVPHPQNFEGNDYVPLVTPSGAITNEFAGPMAATRFPDSSRYMPVVMVRIGCVWGGARLMGLVAGASVPPHVDTNYYWRTHIRVHIPIVTNPDVSFSCGDATVRMAPGECWVFDTFRQHQVHNRGTEKRVHLVADTIGGERLWDLMYAARQPGMAEREPALVAPGTARDPLRVEQANFPVVMNPWELRGLADTLLSHAEPAPALDVVRLRLDRLFGSCLAAWAEHEDRPAGIAHYRALASSAFNDLLAIPGGAELTLDNGIALYKVLSQTVFDNVVESERVRLSKAAAAANVRAAS